MLTLFWSTVLSADEIPYITTKSEITLLSANDGETDPAWRTTLEGLTDYEVKTKDSFTVIRLEPDHPPVCRTVYGTVPCSILGTPRMAMSSDGHFGLIANHGGRLDAFWPLKYPVGEPLTNEDIQEGDLTKQDLAPPRSNMLSMIDLASLEFPIVDRMLFEDYPMLVLAHPDRQHFVVGATKYFYVFRIERGKLVEVSRTLHDKSYPEFDITPAGDRIITTQGDWTIPGRLPVIRWYSVSPEDQLSQRGQDPGGSRYQINTRRIHPANQPGRHESASSPKTLWVERAVCATFWSRTSPRTRPSSLV